MSNRRGTVCVFGNRKYYPATSEDRPCPETIRRNTPIFGNIEHPIIGADREYFQQHPQEREYTRDFREGEFPEAQVALLEQGFDKARAVLPAGTATFTRRLVTVKRIADGMRIRNLHGYIVVGRSISDNQSEKGALHE